MSLRRACSVDDYADRFKRAASTFSDAIPFHTLSKQIKETRRRGLEVDEDDA
jgi:hypothetical protein